MEVRKFKNYEELASQMIFDALESKEECSLISAVLFYEDAQKLIKELLRFKDTSIGCIEIDPPYFDNYDKEFVVSFSDDLEVWCERAYLTKEEPHSREGYLGLDSEILYLDGGANSAILCDADYDKCYQLEINEGVDEGLYCPDCGCKGCVGEYEEDRFICEDEDGYEYEVTTDELIDSALDEIKGNLRSILLLLSSK